MKAIPVRHLIRGLGGIAFLVAMLWVAFTLAVRTRCQSVMDAVRRINRAVTNPQVMRSASLPRGVVSVIRHFGRTSATPYETPVLALRTDDDFAIPLTYASRGTGCGT